jgi:hypothetical protein
MVRLYGRSAARYLQARIIKGWRFMNRPKVRATTNCSATLQMDFTRPSTIHPKERRDFMKFQLKKKGLVVLLLMSFVMLFVAANALANPYAKYAGTTLVINFPNIAYYNYAVQVIPEFTKETGIKVEIDKLEYMKMRDKQLLEMSKPKGLV